MNSKASAEWNDERRWDYAHQVLSLDTIIPFYDYIGIPFRGESAPPFQALLRTYVHEIYLNHPTSFNLVQKQDKLLSAVDNTYNPIWRDEYIWWLLHIFVYRVSEHMVGWSQWRTIFMRCSVRHGWWQRLNLPRDKDEIIQRELSDTKSRIDDARELARSLENQRPSEWDRRVMIRMGIDDEAKEAGEPFSRILLTMSFFMFYLFWVRLLKLLHSVEKERLWESAKAIACDLQIRPEDVLDPSRLQVTTIE